MPEIRTPNNTQHLLELGRTGSGKTQAGFYWLSRKNFKQMPWVIIDTKGEEIIAEIARMDGARMLNFNESPGKHGVYIIRMLPGQEEAIESFLFRLHQRGRCGVFVDEGHSLGRSRALDTLLTQGRSIRTPVILLSQRPAWLSRFAFTEPSFFQVFQLIDERDRDTVQRFIPADRANLDERLPEYYSVWYDVGQDQVTILKPVPPRDEILDAFHDQLMVRKRFI